MITSQIADQPSLRCGKAATCFMLNTKNTILAIFVLVSLFTAGSETNALVDAPASSAVIATTHVRSHDQVKVRTHDDGDVAALALSEPSVKSPPLAKPSIHSSTFTGPFGLNVVPVVHGELLTKWRGVEADIRAESEVLARCLDGTEFCPSAARKFLAIIAEGRARTGRARIGVINRAINFAIRPMSDFAQWGYPIAGVHRLRHSRPAAAIVKIMRLQNMSRLGRRALPTMTYGLSSCAIWPSAMITPLLPPASTEAGLSSIIAGSLWWRTSKCTVPSHCS